LTRRGWDREIDVCRSVARRAGELALVHSARGVEREDKADDSPVTVADRECERLIVSELRSAFPDDGFLGEEGAQGEGRSGRRWIIDPIDGTRDFVRGLPTWAHLIALEADGEVVLGVCHFPAQGQLYWAVRGGGAWVNDRRIRISSIDRKDRAVLCFTAFSDLARSPLADRLVEYMSGYWAVRSMGGCQDAMLVALDKLTGKTIWKSEVPASPGGETGGLGGPRGGRGGFGGRGGGSGAAYASVIAIDFEGQRQYVQLTSKGLIGVAASGAEVECWPVIR